MEHANESTLMWVFITIAFIIPGVVLWFDDAKIHGK
jgi:hypothetical protein